MEGEKNQYQGVGSEQQEEVKDRGLFDFMKKKEEDKKEEKCEEEVIVSGMENVHVTEVEKMETEKKDHGEKKEGLFAKLHRSSSSSSSSSDEEEIGPDGEKRKKKKGLKDKIKEKLGGDKKEEHKPCEEEIKTTTVVAEEAVVTPPPPPSYNQDTSVKVEKVDESIKLEEVHPHDEEKKGFLEKIKEKLPGQKKPTEEVPATTTVTCEETISPNSQEKKGIFGKLMDKIKGPEHKDGEKSGEVH
ncbi:hypothetical protein LUZ63_002853 [Rhynchospora breviuscula]|uniref:Dehydrin n=1 Tax=Rhynchospora breviuscula TaxID=2022672 RepID=A0A9Q0CZL0_9POAL|nr:hypothetical protein LUZ63_002853 [Rhynchospora breviuscula]